MTHRSRGAEGSGRGDRPAIVNVELVRGRERRVLIDVARRVRAGLEVGLVEHPQVKRDVGGDADDRFVVESAGRLTGNLLGTLTPGTIDADYRGEVQVLLINHGDEAFLIQRGERIAQMVIAPVTRVSFEEVATLDETKRGAGGFGSTGR